MIEDSSSDDLPLSVRGGAGEVRVEEEGRDLRIYLVRLGMVVVD